MCNKNQGLDEEITRGRLIDTHAHLTCDSLYENVEQIIEDAKRNGIERMLVICTNFIEYERAVKVSETYDCIDIALGFHPNDLYAFQDIDYERLEKLLQQHKLDALGEIGLDYHYDDVKKADQKVGFTRQLDLAKKYAVPVLIHMREATKDTIDILAGYGHMDGIMHCYSGSLETAQTLIKLGFYISFGGPLTFKNSKGAPEVASHLPNDRLFVETDSPYLTPHPFRGKRNEPKYVTYTFHKLCEIKGMDEEELAIQLRKNYYHLLHK